jgi:hypothetical protein
MKIQFNKEQITAIEAYERVGRVIAGTTYGTINTRALDFKAITEVYSQVFDQKVNTTCVTCCIAAIKKLYNAYDEFLKPAPKPKAKKAAPKKTVAKKAAPKAKK